MISSDTSSAFEISQQDRQVMIDDDFKGCDIGCSTLSDEQDIIIGRQEVL